MHLDWQLRNMSGAEKLALDNTPREDSLPEQTSPGTKGEKIRAETPTAPAADDTPEIRSNEVTPPGASPPCEPYFIKGTEYEQTPLELCNGSSEDDADSRPYAAKGEQSTQTEENMIWSSHDVEVEMLLVMMEQQLTAYEENATEEASKHIMRALHSLVPCYRSLIHSLKQRIVQLEEKVELGRLESTRKSEVVMEEHRQRLNAVAEDYEKQHILALERAGNARQQTESLLLQLAQSRAEKESIADKFHKEAQKLVESHSQKVQALEVQKMHLEQQLNTLQMQSQSFMEGSEMLQRENQELKAKLDELSESLKQKDNVEQGLRREAAQNQDFSFVLEEERQLNRDLSLTTGRQQQQIAILEERLQAVLVELKHKDRLLEAVRTELFQNLSASLGSSGHQNLLRLVSLFQGSSTGGSARTDSGYQGMSSTSRENTSGYSGAASQNSQKASKSLDQNLADLSLELEGKQAAILKTKHKIRAANEELAKLAGLAKDREGRHSRLLELMRPSPFAVSTPGGYEYNESNGDSQQGRTTSSGFVPSSAACLFPKTVRKVCQRRKLHLTSTPEESFNSLGGLSTMEHNALAETNLINKESFSEEMSRMSDNVFEVDPLEPRNIKKCREFRNGMQHGSSMPKTALENASAANGTVLTSEKCHSSPTHEHGTFPIQVTPTLKSISRSPWCRDDDVGKAEHHPYQGPVHGFSLPGSTGIWSYVPPAENGMSAKASASVTKHTKQRQANKGARRSLAFPQEPQPAWPTAPFTYCTMANSASPSTVKEPTFQTQPVPAPVYLNLHVHTHPSSS